ncbi:MAG: chemotaxis protein CheY [Desulfobacterales bacterium SG8_35_2]|jgi:two-component system response regulator RegA|nr:MAG: chemotaxis protein CheY [Desulfobacterales bacterium SG8_35_2]
MQSILLVDDEEQFRERLARAFINRGYKVYQAADVDEALTEIKENNPEWAVVDLKMPGKSGLDLIRAAKEVMPLLKIVVLTGYGSIATATEAVKLGAHYYLPKPADVDEILNAFEKDSDYPGIAEQKEFEAPSLARAEWEHIQRVLTDCDNNITAAAHKLGIHRRTLQRKLYKYAPKK